MEQLYSSEQIQINFSSVDKLPKLYRSCDTSLKLHKMLYRGFWEPSNHDFGDFQVKQHT